MSSTRNRLSTENKNNGYNYKHWNRDGTYSFETWLENARGCKLMPIPVVEIPSLEQVHSDAKQCVNLEEQQKIRIK